MKNPYGQRVLINELVGTCIADELGLIIPEFGICNISESVIESTNTNEEIDTKNSGYGFFSNSYSTAIPLVPYLLPDVQVKQTELLMLFDNIVIEWLYNNFSLPLDLSTYSLAWLWGPYFSSSICCCSLLFTCQNLVPSYSMPLHASLL